MGDLDAGKLLEVDPLELKFPFELRKQISCSIQLTNKSDDLIAFKVKTTSPKKYCVRPNTGIMQPRSITNVVVTMQAQREAPPDMHCKDKFLVQSVVVTASSTAKDISHEMFNKESGNKVDEVKLRVVYAPPPQRPSPVPEECEEGSSPFDSSQQETRIMGRELDTTRKGDIEQEQVSSEAPDVVSKLIQDRDSVMHQNEKLRKELELMRREVSKKQGSGFSIWVVGLVAILGLLLGYYLKK